MSAGITQLLAIGAQDKAITGNASVSYFRSAFKTHTNFAQTVERQTIQGQVKANSMSTVRFERKGDLLSYVYLTPLTNGTQANTAISDWSTVIDKVQLVIGGQVVDEQDAIFTQRIAPTVLAPNLAQSVSGDLFGGPTNALFYPLKFWFNSYAQALPLVALQYMDVEIRIHWGAEVGDKWEVWANYIYLDGPEREYFASQPLQYLVTTVQKAVPTSAKVTDLNFNHPVKAIVSAANTGGSVALAHIANRLKLQMNGIDVGDFRLAQPHFTNAAAYFHCPYANRTSLIDNMIVIPLCLDTSKGHISTGSVNFSRLDSARLISETQTNQQNLYAIGFNLFIVKSGMGSLAFAN